MGSGGWYRWSKKDTVEEHQRLDVRYYGLLNPGLISSQNIPKSLLG
jgi:hypothetical protein